MGQNSFGYLKIFQQQSKNLLLLSKVLLFLFFGFMVFVSLVLFQGWESEVLTDEWLFGLGIFDGLLLIGTLQGYLTLRRYQKKSKDVVSKMQLYLEGDSEKISVLRNQNLLTKTSIERLQTRLENLLPDELPEIVDHQGWDMKTCPFCYSQIEMLASECPNCKTPLDQINPN